MTRQNYHPSICFYNDLSESHITETEYQHAKECRGYVQDDDDGTIPRHCILATDILILADVMSEFSRVCIRDYGLDPKHYVSLPGFSWDSMMRIG